MQVTTAPDDDPSAPDFYTREPFGVYRRMRDEGAAALDPETFRSFEGMDIDGGALRPTVRNDANDVVLRRSAEEQRAGDCTMICVSRSRGPRLVLDL